MDKLTELLAKLAEQLGTTTEYLWGVMIKQAMFSGISDLIFIVTICIGTIFFAKWIKWSRINWDEKYYKSDLEPLFYTGMIIGSIALIMFWIVIVGQFHITLAAFFNPEYWALRNILNAISTVN